MPDVRLAVVADHRSRHQCKEPGMFTPLSAQLAAAKTDDVVRNRRYWGRGRQDDVKPDDRPHGGARGARGRVDRRGRGGAAAPLTGRRRGPPAPSFGGGGGGGGEPPAPGGAPPAVPGRGAAASS